MLPDPTHTVRPPVPSDLTARPLRPPARPTRPARKHKKTTSNPPQENHKTDVTLESLRKSLSSNYKRTNLMRTLKTIERHAKSTSRPPKVKVLAVPGSRSRQLIPPTRHNATLERMMIVGGEVVF